MGFGPGIQFGNSVNEFDPGGQSGNSDRKFGQGILSGNSFREFDRGIQAIFLGSTILYNISTSIFTNMTVTAIYITIA